MILSVSAFDSFEDEPVMIPIYSQLVELIGLQPRPVNVKGFMLERLGTVLLIAIRYWWKVRQDPSLSVILSSPMQLDRYHDEGGELPASHPNRSRDAVVDINPEIFALSKDFQHGAEQIIAII